VKLICSKRSDVKLFFMDVKPQSQVSLKKDFSGRAVELARELELLDEYVFFDSGEVNQNDRQNYLLEADIGVSSCFDTLESRFSFDAHILDCLWAGLPIVCTRGNSFAGIVENEELGLTAPCENEKSVADAIIRLLTDEEKYKKCRDNVANVAQSYRWSKITQPIIDFCCEPMHYASREETENMSIAAAKGSACLEGGSVQERLIRIEQQQHEIEQQLIADSRLIRETHDRSRKLLDWSNLMESRFEKLKSKLGRIKFLRRFIK